MSFQIIIINAHAVIITKNDMTMKEALELARTNKGMILGAIEKELPDLLGNPNGSSE